MRIGLFICALTAGMSLGTFAVIEQEQDTAAVRTAISKSVTLLQTSGHTWIERTGCDSCHHQSLPAAAFSLARARGFTIDVELTRERVHTVLARWTNERERLLQGNTGAIARGPHGAAYALLGLAADDVAPNVTTDAMVHYLAAQQLSDGHFAGQNLMRPPLEDNDVTATAISLRALQLYASPGRQQEIARLVSRARSWLLSRQPRGMEEQSFQLQGLSWSHADSNEIAKRVASIVADQRPDGGWGQFSTLASDAYASGQALVALHQAGGIPTRSATYRNGIRFLLKTQIEDGSWQVRSRARGTQPYVDSGFPHGTDQFISAAGTAWATSALLLSLDVVTPVSGRP
jgi:hypothetical protein